MFEGDEEDKKSASYLQNLTAKIIDNIEIKLSNVHIRYEDSTTIPNTIYSAGVTIDSFSLTSTNDKWETMFVARGLSKLIHKLAKLNNLGIYWQHHSEQLSLLPQAQCVARMKALIYTASNHPPVLSSQSSQSSSSSSATSSPRQASLTSLPPPSPSSNLDFILCPPNALHVQVVKNDEANSVPVLTVTVTSTDLILSVDRQQYHQVMITLDKFKAMSNMQRLMTYRPSVSVRESPRQWWKYAYKAVTNRENAFDSKAEIISRY